jgi:DNA-3-methyladenine glycosylase
MTKRNMVMFGEGGKAYVYFTYGNHFCLNVVTGKIGVGSAVLIRGIEPLTGIEIFKKNRGTDNIFNLTNGPGKICQAFGIGRKDNGTDLFSDKLFIAENDSLKKLIILKSKRIGITKNTDKLWRFFIKDNPHVSRKQKLI